MLFDKNQNHNGSKKIPPQYETVNKSKTHKQSTHITLVHIYIHTWPHIHKNSNTKTHGQTTINTHTRHTIEREITRGKESVRKRNWVGLFSIAIWNSNIEIGWEIELKFKYCFDNRILNVLQYSSNMKQKGEVIWACDNSQYFHRCKQKKHLFAVDHLKLDMLHIIPANIKNNEGTWN